MKIAEIMMNVLCTLKYPQPTSRREGEAGSAVTCPSEPHSFIIDEGEK